MISILFRGILNGLNNYLKSIDTSIGPDDDPVIMGNMAKSSLAGDADSSIEEHIVVSMVNIEEEASLKNKRQSHIRENSLIEVLPAVHLNLFFLFASNYSNSDTGSGYFNSIDRIIHVAEFFQGNKEFSMDNIATPFLSQEELEANTALREVKLVFDLHTLSFEQLNDLWGSLGGKQVPFLLYKVRLLPVQMNLTHGRTGQITDIETSLLHKS